jgi:PAS domain S-box-containing protein
MDPDGAAPPHHDLLVQAVQGMDRPLFVLDGDWRFSYVNPSGARILGRTVGQLVGRDVWVEFPEAVGSPFDELYRRVRATGESGSTEDERAAAVAAREEAARAAAAAAAEAERTGRHLMLLGDITWR